MTLTTDFFDTRTRNWRARLAVSVAVMRELSRYSDPQEMYAAFARRMNQLFPTTRQITLSRRGLDRPQFRVTRFNLWESQVDPWKELHKIPVRAGGLFADLLYADEPRVTDELTVAPDDPAAEFLDGQQSLLAIPLYEHGLSQTMLVVTREDQRAFPPEQIPELVWMTNLFGRATQTMVLSEALKEAYDAADYELRTVAELQQSLLPAEVPRVPGLDVAVHYRTACRAGGDYYDFFPLPGGRLGVLIADVSGHGTPAAVLMAITHSIAHASPAPPATPGGLLAHLNHHLTRKYTGSSGNFVTAFYGVFDPAAGRLTYSTAGHEPPIIIRAADGSRGPLNHVKGLPLGVAAVGAAYEERSVPLRVGDRVVLLTDGVTDATNAAGGVFAAERLDAALAAGPAGADDLLGALLADLDGFAGPGRPADDRTIVVVGRVADDTPAG